MIINEENVLSRKQVFNFAQELVDPIIKKYGLAEYKLNPSPFVAGATMTKVDQHIDQIIRVADWLLTTEE